MANPYIPTNTIIRENELTIGHTAPHAMLASAMQQINIRSLPKLSAKKPTVTQETALKDIRMLTNMAPCCEFKPINLL